MKIAIATRNFTAVSGHAGKTRHWLVYDDVTTICCKVRDLLSRH